MLFKHNKLSHTCINRIIKYSNVLQLDEMGYPLRLCIVKCITCGKTEQIWNDVHEDALKDPNNVILKWTDI